MTSIRFYTTIILFFSFSYQLTAQAPANDELANAIVLTVQNDSCETPTNGTTKKTVASSDNIATCFDNDYLNTVINEVYDVWYKATVPDSGKLMMQVANSSNDQMHGVWSDDDGDENLTKLHCTDTWNAYEKYVLEDGTAGSVLYFQVLAKNAYNTSATLDFTICAYDPDGTLDLPQTQKPLLSYYSNPVGNRLSVESPYEIQALQVFDLMGKEVLHKTPKQQKLTLDTYALAPGAYLLRVETPEGQQTVKLIKK